MILVLVYPAVALIGFDQELVVTKTSVHKRVNESTSQVSSCGVDVCRHAWPYDTWLKQQYHEKKRR